MRNQTTARRALRARAPQRPRRVVSKALATGLSDELVRESIWRVFAISSHLDQIRRAWGALLGVSGPQWIILMAIDHLDQGEGVAVKEVSTKLQVNATFITTQTKLLEEAGLLRRKPSSQDARVVLMSFTDKARRELERLAERRRQINDLIFAGVNQRELAELVGLLGRVSDGARNAAAALNGAT
jgi:MarR family transcriptional regulator, organic hydroperoxide resistance regulator